ncbi:MAG: hypothetical protein OQJ97_12815 [Rhodospirillales bacterium]|nr:hypothetical protein [Rhodospirillales bacterium]
MSDAIFGLLTAYVLIALLLLNLCLFSRISVWVKVLSIVLVSGFYYVTYVSLTGVLGWPTTAKLPERFLLLSRVIVEPDKESGGAGAIYLWADDLGEGKPSMLPRSYELPYSAVLHKRVEEAVKRQRQGIVQIGGAENATEKTVSKEGGKFGELGSDLKFTDLPDPRLPEK